LLCDGQAYNRSDYPALSTVLASTYGGTTNQFNVPNLVNRVPQGAGTTARGASAGGTASIAETHLPSHTHNLNSVSLSNHLGHAHDSGGLTTGSSGAHSHSVAIGEHTHGIVPNNTRPLMYKPSSSIYHVQLTEAGFFTVPYGEVTWQYGGSASGAGTYTAGSSGSAHSHAVTSGNTGTNGSHTHTFSGSPALVGGGTALPVSPAHVGVNYIIKT
jgi:hypothetical protein